MGAAAEYAGPGGRRYKGGRGRLYFKSLRLGFRHHPTGPNRYYEAYSQLASILYALQVISPYPSDLEGPASPITRDETQQPRNIYQIFAQVSSLCNTLAWLTTNTPNSGTAADLDVVAFLRTITSLATTVSTIYTQRLDKYKMDASWQ